MSVLKNKRRISAHEYENTFSVLYQHSQAQTMKVTKRRRKWLCVDIDRIMNEIYYRIIFITDSYTRDRKERADVVGIYVKEIYVLFEELSEPLTVLWNVQKYPEKKIDAWIEKIYSELTLLNRMSTDEIEFPSFIHINWKAVNEMEFTRNMCELHRYTHGKVANANMEYDGTQGALLIRLVNDALFEVFQANKILPETKKEYKKRRQHISKAITCLYGMNRPMLSYINLMNYSERILDEWAEMLCYEVKLLKGLQKSDSERFGKLE